MADLTITAANIAFSSAAKTISGIAGETVFQGEVVYISTADGKIYKAAANTANAPYTLGVALTTSNNLQPITVLVSDPNFTPGATLTQGQIYILSNTAGKLCPKSDLAAGMYPIVLMVAKSTTTAECKINAGTAVL